MVASVLPPLLSSSRMRGGRLVGSGMAVSAGAPVRPPICASWTESVPPPVRLTVATPLTGLGFFAAEAVSTPVLDSETVTERVRMPEPAERENQRDCPLPPNCAAPVPAERQCQAL
jgi:hypothetical protein